jgi:P2-related tail formation protein
MTSYYLVCLPNILRRETICTAATQRTKSLVIISLRPIVIKISLDALQITESWQYDPWAVPFHVTHMHSFIPHSHSMDPYKVTEPYGYGNSQQSVK